MRDASRATSMSPGRSTVTQVSSWPFADAILRLMEFDNITSTVKVRRAGFHDCIDTEDMFKTFFAKLRRDRVIP